MTVEVEEPRRLAAIAAELARARRGKLPEVTFAGLVDHAASAHRDSEAVVLEDARITFGQLQRLMDGTASRLRGIGVHRGSHVAIMGINSIDWLACFLAVMRLGAVAVPLNTRYTDAELKAVLTASDATHLLAQPTYQRRDVRPLLDELGALGVLRIASLDDVVAEAVPGPAADGWSPDPGARPDDVAVLLFTSGSTSAPKGCLLTHQGIVRNACLHVERLGIDANDRWFSAMPFFHAGGLVWGVGSILVSGATLVAQPVFDAATALTLQHREEATYAHGVDTMFARMMEHPDFESRLVASVRSATSIGPAALLRRIASTMGIAGIESKWGLSEGYGNLTLCDPAEDPFEMRVESVGRPFPGIEYRIGEERPLSTGDVGEILVRGCAMKGYYKDPAATAAIIDQDGWIHTGDLGRFDDAGYLFFMGRSKQMLKVGGENVSALEIETYLMGHPAVELAFVVETPHPELGQVPVAFVVAQGEPDEATLLGYCRAGLAPFKVPYRILRISGTEIPLTGSGKIAKNELGARAHAVVGTR